MTACEPSGRSVRHYREINIAAEAPAPASMDGVTPPFAGGSGSGMGQLPPEMRAPTLPLAWQTPEGWEETPGSGMRVVTFRVQGQECSILTFPGDVGGVEANIRRWLGQIKQQVSDEALRSFAAAPAVVPTEGGFSCSLFDFAELIPADAPQSILAGIIPVGEQTAFVKLMGDRGVLAEQKPVFEALCRSIRMKQ